MTHAFAIAYDWLFPPGPSPSGRCFAGHRRQRLEASLSAYQDPAQNGWWAVSPSNWNLVANCGIGLGALAVLAEAPEFAGPALDHACRSLPLALDAFQPDGGFCEGPFYWGTAPSTPAFLGRPWSRPWERLGLDKHRGSLTGLFPLYLTGPTGQAFNFADSDEKIPWLSQLFWLARKTTSLPWPGPPWIPPAPGSWPCYGAILRRPGHSRPVASGQIFSGVEVASHAQQLAG